MSTGKEYIYFLIRVFFNPLQAQTWRETRIEEFQTETEVGEDSLEYGAKGSKRVENFKEKEMKNEIVVQNDKDEKSSIQIYNWFITNDISNNKVVGKVTAAGEQLQ